MVAWLLNSDETIMAQSEFDTPIRVVLGPDRTVRVVSNTAEAIACLSSIYWPKAGRRCRREAAHVCMQAWRGYRTVEDARLAFIAAAQVADVLFGGHRRPEHDYQAAQLSTATAVG